MTEKNHWAAVEKDKEMLGLIFENVSDLIAVIDIDGRRLYNSPSYASVLGDPKSLQGTDSFAEIHPQDRERIRKIFQETVKTGISQKTEYRFLLRDGTTRYIESLGNPIRNHDGKVTKVVVVSRDVTERKMVEDALRQSETRIRTVVENSPIVFYALDRNGIITFSEGKGLEALRVRPGENVGRSVFELYGDYPNVETNIRRALRGEVLNDIVEIRGVAFDSWYYPLLGGNNEVTGVIGVSTVVTDRVRGEKLQAAVYRIAQAADNAASLEELYPALHKIIQEVMPASNFYIALYDEDENLLHFPYFVDEADEPSPPQKPGKGLTAYVLRTGKPLLCTSAVFDDLVSRGEAELIGVPSPIWLGVPLIVDYRTIGAMVVQHYTDAEAYGTVEQHMLEFVSSQVARAIERKRTEKAQRESEERTRLIIDTALDAVVTMNEGGIIAGWNTQAEIIFGWPREDAIGRELADTIIPVRYHEAHRKGLKHYLDTGIGPVLNKRIEVSALRRDGTEFPVELAISPTRVGDSTIFTAFIRDIAEQKQSAQNLKQSEEQYRRFFEEDLAGNYITTPDGSFRACNSAFLHIFGFKTFEEVVNSDVNSIYPNTKAREEFLELIRKSGRVEYYETQLRRRDGSPVYVIENSTGTFDGNGELVELRGHLIDVSERKKLEDQLIQSQKMEAVGQLASGIAHDFNNVMSVVLGAVHLIKTQSADAQIQRFARMIEDTTLRGTAIAKQLLQFSHAEASKLKPISLTHLVLEVNKLIEHSFLRMILVELHISLKQGVVMGDAGQLHQMLLNLCINARDAISERPQGTVGGKLTLSLEEAPGDSVKRQFGESSAQQYVVLHVADNGTGITEDVRRRMFEPFFTTKGVGKGTGLGLSIVHGIVKSHRGFIDVESTPGKGTTFRIFLPAVPHQISAIPAEVSQAVKGGKETILVIEDEEALRELVKETLSKAGYTVIEAADGEEGVTTFREMKDSISLVLSDMGLPRLSGEQVFRELKKIDPAVKVIFSTGYIKEEKKTDLLESGAVNIIHKPHSVVEMLRAIPRRSRFATLRVNSGSETQDFEV